MSLNPSFPGPNDAAIFARPMPRGMRTGNGLQWTGGMEGGCLSLFDPKEKYDQQVPEQVAGGGSFRGCWAPSKIDNTHIKLTPGTLTCGTIFTPTVSSVTVDASALTHVYLRATLAPYYTDGYVNGGGATAVDVIGSTTVLNSDNTYGYILLCDWQAGAVVARYQWFSKFAVLNNQGAGDVLFIHWDS